MYAAVDRQLSTENQGVTPYFPVAFAKSLDEPLEFDFSRRVLDDLRLPRGLSPEDQDGPVVFGDASQAVRYLREHLSGWEDAVVTSPDSAQEVLSKEALFKEEGSALRDLLVSGDEALDANLDKVRLDRSVPYLYTSTSLFALYLSHVTPSIPSYQVR